MGRQVLRASRCFFAFWLVLLTAVVALAQPRPASGVHVAAPLKPVSGLNCADATTRCVPSEYATVQACANATVAGDTCLVSAGTYAEVVSESSNGSAGNTITYVASGAVTINGFGTTGDYVRIIGFTVECGGVRGTGIDINNADAVEIWNNTVQNCTDDSIRTDGGSQSSQGHNNIILGNVVKNSSALDFQIRGNSNLIAYNESQAPLIDFLYLFGQRNRLINNYSHGINSDPASHTDFIQTGASGDTLGGGQALYEANFYADESGSDHHCTNMEANAGSDAFHIFRRNVWSTSGDAGQCYALSVTMDDTKIYNETVSFAGLYNNVEYGGTPASRRAVLNNIYAPSWWASQPPLIYDDTPAVHDYGIYYDPGGTRTFPGNVTSETHSQINVNPVFVNAATRDFHLQSGSPARDAGTALTTTSGSGTGTTFNVATGGGGYFRGSDAANLAQYGGAFAPGDIITVGTDVVQISSISTDAITVTSSFTWANGESVYLGTDTTPDIGAFPYKSGGYTLSATYVNSGGTVTVTPNDASLVRWVICYSDGIPYAVDNASPYTCAAPGGTLTVRVYPLYASTTLWAVATP